jgi:energy-coupling factor transporter ATP-binding protein EcfA2
MKITRLSIENFRSIQKVEMPELGDFVVFYGPNGAGKSNVLEALKLLVRCLEAAQEGRIVVEREDFNFSSGSAPIRVVASVDGLKPRSVGGYSFPRQVRLAIAVWRDGRFLLDVVGPSLLNFAFWLTGKWEDLMGEGEHRAQMVYAGKFQETISSPDGRRAAFVAVQEMLTDLAAHLWQIVPAIRTLHTEKAEDDPRRSVPIPELLHKSLLKRAIIQAQMTPDRVIRRRLAQLHQLLEGAPLFRPPFEAIHDPSTDQYDLQEVQNDQAIRLQFAGLGIQQLYCILAYILLMGTDVVGIEEPEAHLYARGAGLELRQLLRRAVGEGMVQQIFVATHSNLFDLDPTGYWEVSRDPQQGTRVERRTDLADIDRRHLYEPGPTRHILLDVLHSMSQQEVVFVGVDGKEYSAKEMIDLLIDEPARPPGSATSVVEDYLQDVHWSAVRAVQALAHRRKKG